MPGFVARSCPRGRAATAPPGIALTCRTCPPGPWPRPPSAAPTPMSGPGRGVPAVDVHHVDPARRMGGCTPRTAPPSIPSPTTTPGPRGMRFTFAAFVGPVQAEPATGRRLPGAVLLRRRTPTPARCAPARRHPRHHPRATLSARSSGRRITRCGGPPTRPSPTPAGPCRSGISARRYVDPDTGEVLPTWDESPSHRPTRPAVARGPVRHSGRHQGPVGRLPEAGRRIGYLAKYLTKYVADCHPPPPQPRPTTSTGSHALRWLPCSPAARTGSATGSNPTDAPPGLRPGVCKGKAHRREYLGYGGRRVLVSRNGPARP